MLYQTNQCQSRTPGTFFSSWHGVLYFLYQPSIPWATPKCHCTVYWHAHDSRCWSTCFGRHLAEYFADRGHWHTGWGPAVRGTSRSSLLGHSNAPLSSLAYYSIHASNLSSSVSASSRASLRAHFSSPTSWGMRFICLTMRITTSPSGNTVAISYFSVANFATHATFLRHAWRRYR